METHAVVFCFSFVLTLTFGADVILAPVKRTETEAALVLIQGAEISAEQYKPLASSVQSASSLTLWIGIPDFTLDVPNPLEIGKEIQRILTDMKNMGMNTTTVFFAGHSLGGIVLEDWVNTSSSAVSGLILMGSYLQRKYTSFSVPTLTISGELDGLCRVTRSMESYYRWILHSDNASNAMIQFPVVIIPGMNHFEFASGDPPLLVRERDLKAEIAVDVAHNTVAILINEFMEIQLKNDSGRIHLVQAVNDTGMFIQPLLKAYEMEGFYHFIPPCYDQTPSAKCNVGCPWTETAQQIMGGVDPDKIHVSDAFHPVDQINPIHLPHVLNNCSANQTDCVLNVTTVSQNVYEIFDSLDTAFLETSASEIRAKLKSRQAIMEAEGYPNLDFNKTDGGSLCKIINQAAFQWALNISDNKTVQRFQKFGEPMVMGEDEGPYNVGPLWIWNPLKYKQTKDASGNKILLVQSVMMRTPIPYYIPVSAGFHYCKLLSPARAIEWIYVDGLRAHYQ
jgi:hypothetical protein